MNLKNMFKDFNPSKFLVFFSLLLFSFLFALRLDESILWSYWIIFLPIWIWKVTVISGALVGSYIWWKHPQYRMENNNYTQYKAMVISTGMHLLLLMFEILACDNLAVGAEHHPWILVFIPLMFMSVISIGICVWAFKNDRTFELELFCSVNILQFIFLALRLDNTVKWSWVIVFIPLWILMCLALIGVLYLIVLAIILLKNASIIPEQRRGNFSSALRYAFLVVPLLVFEILLANKLDGDNQLKYIAVVIPLCISLATLMCFSFGAKAGNVWWFGIRMDFCQFLLGKCPILQEYGNISYSLHGDESQENDLVNRPRNLAKPDSSRQNKDIIFDQKIIVPIISIETPD